MTSSMLAHSSLLDLEQWLSTNPDTGDIYQQLYPSQTYDEWLEQNPQGFHHPQD